MLTELQEVVRDRLRQRQDWGRPAMTTVKGTA